MSVSDEFAKAIPLEKFPAGKELQTLPQPPQHLFGFLGNLPDIDPVYQFLSFRKLADLYGEVYLLNALNRKFIVISSYEYARQIQDDEQFEKIITGPLEQVRALMGDGLFTGYPSEINWHKAHRLLMPVFGPLGIKKMFPEMLDIASQMILRWDRAGADNRIDCSDDFTRLTFDTIGLCAFNYRFNQFYRDHGHPFASQMSDTLLEAGKRGNRTALENALRRWSAGKMQEDIKKMQDLVDGIVEDRKNNPKPEVNDLLNVMLEGADPVTGEKLSPENIRNNMITFLVAGHETTSGTLSFLFYNLLKNPEKLHKAQQEVDSVLGNDTITIKHIPQFKYIAAAIKETLRMYAPVGGLWRRPKKEVVLSGKYCIGHDTGVLINLHGLHRDPKVWGDDADQFKPERILDDDHPQEAWRPFGVGMRACIGRFFAEQEMILNVALILQRFQVEMDDPQYELIVKAAGTMKPKDFAMKVRRRPGKSLMVGLAGGVQATQSEEHNATNGNSNQKSKMMIAYGSNAGTCKTLAEDLQTMAPDHGFEAQILSLDSITENMTAEAPVVIVTSSYEGKPTDNAKKFVSWLDANVEKVDPLKSVQYAVFGVGNTEWASTYQRIPKMVDGLMAKQGADRICEPCFSDVQVDTNGDWEKWTEKLWQALRSSGQGGEQEYRSELRASVIKHDEPEARTVGDNQISWGIVKNNRSLGGLEVGLEKRSIEIQLPSGVSYQSGDYLSVEPLNHPDIVERVLKRFGLHADDQISVSGTRKAFLATAEPVNAKDLFARRVELNATATQRQLETLAKYAQDEKDRTSITSLADQSNFQTSVIAKNYSVLDVLEDHHSVELSLATYLDMLKPLVARLYSIASSSLAQHPSEGTGYTVTLVYDVHAGAARSGNHRSFNGVASSYLASLEPGMRICCAVRSTNVNFHLPADSETPVVFIAAGTGIAPMRGFVEERAAIAAAGAKKLGPAILYFGCRDYKLDNLCCDELDRWQASGAVDVRRTFSRQGPEGEDVSFHYVHERLWAEKEELVALVRQGGKILLCGSAGKLAKSTADTLKRIWLELNPGKTEEQAEEWLQSIKETRYVTDVFE